MSKRTPAKQQQQQQQQQRQENRPPAVIEHLERRSLMSATVDGTRLVVVGTTGDDEISVELNPNDSSKVDITENGERTTFSKAGLVRVRIFGDRGDDVITAGDDIGLKVGLFGGRGDDELRAGNGKELLVGGHGDDDLEGGPRHDWIMGMQGEDEFHSTDDPREWVDLSDEDGVIIELEEAPAAVQAAVLELLDGAEIENLIREQDDGEVFELEWEDLDGGPHSAKIRPDGDVVELESEIDVEELPDAVTAAILARYPIATITEAEELRLPGQPLLYEVEVFLRRTVREIVVTPQGEILQDELERFLDT